MESVIVVSTRKSAANTLADENKAVTARVLNIFLIKVIVLLRYHFQIEK